MYVNIDELNRSVNMLNKSIKLIHNLKAQLQSASSKIPSGDEQAGAIKGKIEKIKTWTANEEEFLSSRSSGLSYEIQNLEGAETDNKSISQSIDTAQETTITGGSTGGGSSVATTATVQGSDGGATMQETTTDSQLGKVDNLKSMAAELEEEKTKVDEINNIDNIEDSVDNIKESEDLKAQVTAVIDILSDGETTFSEEEIETITKAIESINKTKIFDGLDSDICNGIIAQIIKDYKDGKIEDLDKLTKEDLENYIKSNPELSKNLQLAEVTKQLNELIEKGNITKEQIKSIMDNNINIYSSDEEFKNAYIKSGGTEANASEVRLFYDKENKIINIKGDATSSEIAFDIVSKIDDLIVEDPKTGKPTYYKDVSDISEVVKEEISEVNGLESQK